MYHHHLGVDEGQVALPKLSGLRHVVADYAASGLSLKDHPIRFLRAELRQRRAICAEELADADRFPQGRGVAVAGLCLVRQRPGTAGKICFMTLEDETGFANLVIYASIFDRFRPVARGANAMLAHGRIDRQGEVVHVVVYRLESLDDRLQTMESMSRNFR